MLFRSPCSGGQSCVVSNGVASCANSCVPHCDSGFLVDASCAKIDCKPQAGQCVDDALGARCASVFCPPQGKTTTCMEFLSPKQVFTCQDGQLLKSGCNPGQVCLAQGGAHCADGLCVKSSSDIPAPHHVCADDGSRLSCDAQGLASPAPCARWCSATPWNGLNHYAA